MKSDEMIEQLMELVGFLLSSARGLLEEPHSYAIFRLLDAAGRLLEVMDEQGLLDDSLQEIKAQVDGMRFAPMGEDEELAGELDALVVAWIERMPL
jgi:hypothetical protein